jgi:hypothetical protein
LYQERERGKGGEGGGGEREKFRRGKREKEIERKRESRNLLGTILHCEKQFCLLIKTKGQRKLPKENDTPLQKAT